jgi:hypothetical protein
MFNKGVVLAGARQFISNHSPVFNSWKRGNFKPVGVQALQFEWEVRIEYFDILEEIEQPSILIRYFNYPIRDEAITFRNRAIKQLEQDGKTIKTVRIRLVRL